jgi:hypothetical protein
MQIKKPIAKVREGEKTLTFREYRRAGKLPVKKAAVKRTSKTA